MDADRAKGIAFEADYWQAMLEELGKINEAILGAASSTSRAQMHVTLAPLMPPAMLAASIEEARPELERTMGELQTMQAAVQAMIELATGRGRALKAEALGGTHADS